MADKREVFTIVENDSTGEGVKLPARSEGDTSGGNHAPVVDAKDSSGNYILHHKRTEGEAASGTSSMPSLAAKDSSGNLQFINLRDEGDSASGVDAQNVMPVKDLSGNLQYINARDEGDAASGVDALPGLVAVDPSGNFKYLNLNSDGELVISNQASGTPMHITATVTPSAINTLTTVTDLNLNSAAYYEEIMCRGSSFFPCKWQIVQVNDTTITVLDSFLTSSGQFSFSMKYNKILIQAGTSGVQALRLRVTQLSGAVSDAHGYVEALQKA